MKNTVEAKFFGLITFQLVHQLVVKAFSKLIRVFPAQHGTT